MIDRRKVKREISKRFKRYSTEYPISEKDKLFHKGLKNSSMTVIPLRYQLLIYDHITVIFNDISRSRMVFHRHP